MTHRPEAMDVDGPAGAEAIRMAIEDVGGSAAGRPVELVLGDHRNDAALAADVTDSLSCDWRAQ